MYLMRSNLNVAALKQADGLAVTPRHDRYGIRCRWVPRGMRAGRLWGLCHGMALPASMLPLNSGVRVGRDTSTGRGLHGSILAGLSPSGRPSPELLVNTTPSGRNNARRERGQGPAVESARGLNLERRCQMDLPGPAPGRSESAAYHLPWRTQCPSCKGSSNRSLQPGVFRPGVLKDRDVGVGVLP
jgi:hypothetical protein